MIHDLGSHQSRTVTLPRATDLLRAFCRRASSDVKVSDSFSVKRCQTPASQSGVSGVSGVSDVSDVDDASDVSTRR